VLDIQPYVLRYWQTEFPALASKKGAGSGQEYNAEDLETVRRIKELLYDEGYTIASAKKKLSAELEEGGVRGRPPAAHEAQDDDSRQEAAEVEPPQTADAPENPPAAADASDSGEIGALTRRVERLEGGVAALVSQARQLAAELKPEMGAEDD
jgi:DNA-binding transcriptional MerR regulator